MAKPTDKIMTIADCGGMYLEIHPNGAKYWRLQYRHADKHKRISLGVYPNVSLKDAREKCDELRKIIKSGEDPSLLRKKQKIEISLNALRNAILTKLSTYRTIFLKRIAKEALKNYSKKNALLTSENEKLQKENRQLKEKLKNNPRIVDEKVICAFKQKFLENNSNLKSENLVGSMKNNMFPKYMVEEEIPDEKSIRNSLKRAENTS
jgi:hypothetical protein